MDKVAAIHLNINETQRQLPRPLKDAPFDYYRYKRHTDNDLICPLCRVAQETELHFVLCCPVLRTLEPLLPLRINMANGLTTDSRSATLLDLQQPQVSV